MTQLGSVTLTHDAAGEAHQVAEGRDLGDLGREQFPAGASEVSNPVPVGKLDVPR